MAEIAVLGAGSWGTALAVHLAAQGHVPRLLFRDADAAERVTRERENSTYLGGVHLSESVQVTADARRALEGACLALVVVPVKGLDLAADWLRSWEDESAPVVSCAKGIRPDSLETPSRVLARALPGRARFLAALSGPNFAAELARGDPTAAVIAAPDPGVARSAQALLTGGPLRLYTNSDLAGVELAGALKNVIAIAAGVVDGLGYGANTTAALMTRGLSEVTRLGVALGGAPSTFAGLAGMGDLVLTCTGGLSRNRKVGRELARGRTLAEVVDSMRMVAEGVASTRAALDLALQEGIEMPIVHQVAAILFDGRRPADALAELLSRDLKEEEGYGRGPGRQKATSDSIRTPSADEKEDRC